MHDLAKKVTAIGSEHTSQAIYHMSSIRSKDTVFQDAKHLSTHLHSSNFDSPILEIVF